MSDTLSEAKSADAKAAAEISEFLKTKSALVDRYRRVNNILTLLLVAVVLLFVALFYTAMSRNFTQDKLQDALQLHGPETLAQMADAAVEVGLAVYPVYQEEITRRMIEESPKFAEATNKELEKLTDQITSLCQEQFRLVIHGIFVRPDSPLVKEMPNQKFSKQDMEKIVAANLKDTEKIPNTKLAEDVQKLKDVIFKFDDKNLPDDEVKLSKTMVHDLLMLLDIEIKEGK